MLVFLYCITLCGKFGCAKSTIAALTQFFACSFKFDMGCHKNRSINFARASKETSSALVPSPVACSQKHWSSLLFILSQGLKPEDRARRAEPWSMMSRLLASEGLPMNPQLVCSTGVENLVINAKYSSAPMCCEFPSACDFDMLQ